MASAVRRNLLVLAVAQALFQCGLSVDLTLTGLVGFHLAPQPALATLPFACITVGAFAATAPASWLIARYGHRLGFAVGAASAVVGGALSAVAIVQHTYWLFCVGTAGVGIYQAFANYYRYAAADRAAPEQRGRAIATVLAGGVVAALFGPFLATAAKDTLSVEFAGSYLLVSVLAALSGLVLVLLRPAPKPRPSPLTASMDQPAQPAGSRPSRSVRQLLALPELRTGVAATAIGYLTMMLVMTAAPIAAVHHHHTIEQGALIVQWHMVGMYAPALFAGWSIQRLGAPRLLLGGIALTAAGALACVLGTGQPHFLTGLLLVGVGWSLMYVSGTTLVAGAYQPRERARAQATAEALTMTGSATGSLSAGLLLQELGWASTNLLVLLLLVPCAVLAWGRLRAASTGEVQPVSPGR